MVAARPSTSRRRTSSWTWYAAAEKTGRQMDRHEAAPAGISAHARLRQRLGTHATNTTCLAPRAARSFTTSSVTARR